MRTQYTWAPAQRALIGGLVALLVSVSACGDATAPTPGTPAGALGPGTAGRWTTATPESVGLDPVVLKDIEDRIESGEFGQISSLLVLRDGVLVYEHYALGQNSSGLHRAYSVTKSVTSLLMGIAVKEGRVVGVDRSVLELLPAYAAVANASPEKAGITLEHVLQMRVGFEWDEQSTNYTNGVNPTLALVASPDWTQHVLDLPLTAPPGTRFDYNSGVSMLMSSVLTEHMGETAEDFARSRLFGPLGIDDWTWSATPGGLSNSGWGLWLRPRDMAALGQLVLDGGMWQGTELVPEAWIEASAMASTRFTDGTGYGYQWWLGADGTGATSETRAMAAWGWGGQFIIVLPRERMVLVTTAENYEGGGFNPEVLGDLARRAAGVPAG